jgi:hypothetical protein
MRRSTATGSTRTPYARAMPTSTAHHREAANARLSEDHILVTEDVVNRAVERRLP